ncbi:MAG: HEAT repeat domain-containing protein [Planctomycetaceae bacterium]|nr:HEAT repeat domain-containing protein [Planctomycetaceae bacterium]
MADSEKIATLIVQLDGEAEQRAAAAEALAQLGAGCNSACVPLVRACGSDEITREWATAALEEMGPPPADAIPNLIKLVENDSPNIAYWAITLLGRGEEIAQQACESLAKLIASDRDLNLRERAVWAVQRIGHQSPTVLDALKTASQSKHARLARLAGEAFS